jgi:triosephosphate isomerase
VKHIFVNLKRFDIPKKMGGICPENDPLQWTKSIITESIGLQLGALEDIRLSYLLPESLIPTALETLSKFPIERTHQLDIGCQGIHWQDVSPGGNFGAFTTLLPASAAFNLGCTWAIIGHSEERKAKSEIIQAFAPRIAEDLPSLKKAQDGLNTLIQAEVNQALKAGLNVLLCIGESEQERGPGPFEQQQSRIREILKAQLLTNLADLSDQISDRQITIGYEPIWAIGPGKSPPGQEYIRFVSAHIKDTTLEHFGTAFPVVYGGGLKEENAAMIASIDTIDGGLVALTRFSGDIGFSVPELASIIEKYAHQ